MSSRQLPGWYGAVDMSRSTIIACMTPDKSIIMARMTQTKRQGAQSQFRAIVCVCSGPECCLQQCQPPTPCTFKYRWSWGAVADMNPKKKLVVLCSSHRTCTKGWQQPLSAPLPQTMVEVRTGRHYLSCLAAVSHHTITCGDKGNHLPPNSEAAVPSRAAMRAKALLFCAAAVASLRPETAALMDSADADRA